MVIRVNGRGSRPCGCLEWERHEGMGRRLRRPLFLRPARTGHASVDLTGGTIVKYEQYRRTLARHGLGEPDGTVLLRLLGNGSPVGCRIADLSGMFADAWRLPEAIRRLERDGLVARLGSRVFMTDMGRDVAGELFRCATGSMAETIRPLPRNSAARRMDENLRSVFG